MKVETYKITGWKEKETGLLISENEDWILVKHIPVDYVIDGYKLYRKSAVQKRKSKSKEDKISRVLQLKNVKTNKPDTFSFGSALEILKWSEEKYDVFEFQDTEAELFYGKLNRVIGDMFHIDLITSNGRVEKDYDYDFLTDDIIAITFETDYFESVRLLMNDELKKEGKLNIV
ncbi:hypothetical protein ATE84_4525 [Aquimarina sp. MAR_2010_214]|uniref:hypothetical protein n=1 Tax=Aquimarina sp. MAR_2010_214 TaxID=1250026 RepID=UPI000C70164D|nr:hypothetical protein [Aquimarina sp. MAR_2010_214]PKV52410.1 hypothetical protein ATE84_4525 [Aquimarina sp. MAR_2010_214]